MKLLLLSIAIYCVGNSFEDEITSSLLPDTHTCGQQKARRIVGGEIAQLNEFPWMALLQFEKHTRRSFDCGGSLINNRYVLTAAHCIRHDPPRISLVGVRLGEYDVSKEEDCDEDEPGFENCSDDPLDIEIEQEIVHEHGDIALLRLKEEVKYSEWVKPICLPLTDELRNKNYDSLNLTVAGWGRTENSSHSDVKLKVNVPVKSSNDCTKEYKSLRKQLDEKQICAGGEEGKDSCTGDSGGPLMYHHRTDVQDNWYEIGVVSFGPTPCGTKGIPGVYVRVTSYMPWIVENLKP